MIRFAWMQFRTQAVVATVGLVVVAVALAITGPHLVHLYDAAVATCAASGDCSTATSAFLKNDRALHIGLDVLVVVLPVIIGMFWGPPLVARELETGTFRLAWTQSVTRTRWLTVKLACTGLAAIVIAGLVSLMVTWWSSPVDRLNTSAFTSFDQRGIAPIGYAVFALALGTTAGTVIRRTLPAMVATLTAFLVVRLAFIHWVRPHLIAPVLRGLALNPQTTGYGSYGAFGGLTGTTLQPNPPDIPNAWITSTQIVDKAGHVLTSQVLNSDCPGIGTNGSGPASPGHHTGIGSGRSVSQVPAAVQQRLQECVSKIGTTYHELVAYQPSSRYWAFQWYETAIFVGAALILAGVSLWWVRRRLV